ncbi:MAG: potassium transporter [Chloroflexi bacterium]|nr:potassium transporter [Chloroflexota bacterium]
MNDIAVFRVWHGLPIPLRLVIGLAVLVAFGTALLLGVDRGLAWNEALFTTVSALTVTGLSVIVPGRDLTGAGQLVLLLLIQLGGMGFMVLAVVILNLLGWQVRIENRVALRDSLGLNNVGEIVRLMRLSVQVLLIIELIGALCLFLHWRTFVPLSEGQILWYALFHAVSAMCNAGFELFTGLPAFPGGPPMDTLTLAILCMLIFLGGIGIPVISNVVQLPKNGRLRLHVKIALAMSVFLIVAGAAAILLAEGRPGGVLSSEPSPWRRIVLAMAQSISARTAGFAWLPNFDQMTASTRFVLMALMFIGASPASMGGGIKTVTFAVLLLSLYSQARRIPDVILLRRTIGVRNVQKAAAVLTAALLVVCGATWLLALTQNVSLDRALFEVISAFATCGLTLALTFELDLFGQMLIMFIMFWGRLGALTVVAAVAPPRRRTAVSFPEDEVLIG